MEKIKMVFENESVCEFYCWSDEKMRKQFWQDWLIMAPCREGK